MSKAIQKLMATGGTASRVIVADVSGSMRGERIRRLQASLERIWSDVGAKLLAFNWQLLWCDSPANLPPPDGSTNLAAALYEAAKLSPAEVIVISDGRPDDEEAAIHAAAAIPGVISTFFCGADSDVRGKAFLARLARVGGGEFACKDIGKCVSIESEIRGIIALDKPIAL